jgi:nucleoid-associated protein YgaU
VVSVDANITPDSEDVSENTETSENTENSDTSDTATSDADTQTTEAAQANSQDTAADNQDTETIATVADTPKYYTVKAGDTLSSISFSMYHSILYVDNIMEANNMKNGDDIYVGQTIIIPEVP